MPSINEVWEQALQINANLVVVHQDLVASLQCCHDSGQKLVEANDWLESIHDTLDAGFASLSTGLIAVEQRQDLTNKLLVYQIDQQRTMICLLDKIARSACDLVNENDGELRAQRQMATDLGALRNMAETVHPDAALVEARAEAEKRALEKCCPPPADPRPCDFVPCPAPAKLEEPKSPGATRAYEPPKTHISRAPAGKDKKDR